MDHYERLTVFMKICCQRIAAQARSSTDSVNHLVEIRSLYSAIIMIQKQLNQACDSFHIYQLQHVFQYPRAVVYGCCCTAILACLVMRCDRNTRNQALTRPRTPDLEKPLSFSRDTPKSNDREPGGGYRVSHIRTILTPIVWIPQQFKRPSASPYPDWDIHTTKPLPYRPFKYGPYVS
jgi:hypothetical protein